MGKRTMFAVTSTTIRAFLIAHAFLGAVAILAMCFARDASAQQMRLTEAQSTARARQIVSRMTLQEKIAQLHGARDDTHDRVVLGLPQLTETRII